VSAGPRRFVTRLSRAVQLFLQTEASGGAVLLVASGAALAWANIAPESYERVWHLPIDAPLGLELPSDLVHWINDGLMALFFFVVGVEIKRELVEGELADKRKAALPVIAALGGMVVPALFYLALNRTGVAVRGWGIPMATDIAFALGVLALLGPRVPPALKVFLLSLAIADDIGAIAMIALFYASDLNLVPLAVAGALFAAIAVAQRRKVWRTWIYAGLGASVWLAVYQSGVHATIAGVAVGLMTPVEFPAAPKPRIAERLERVLHPLTSFAIVPIFALANAGIQLGGGTLERALDSTVAGGVALGLVGGKTVGVLAFTWIGSRARAISLPTGVGWAQITGVAAIAGIGFTVALFISSLAFEDPALQEEARVGIAAGSLASALIGAAILGLAGRPGRPTP
jgi:Na+:H+ antiporter, NhaA family